MAKGKLNLTLDTDLIRDIKIKALKENRSVSDIVTELLNAYLQKEKK